MKPIKNALNYKSTKVLNAKHLEQNELANKYLKDNDELIVPLSGYWFESTKPFRVNEVVLSTRFVYRVG